MPVGPRGQRRPSDVVGCAVKVMQIATGGLANSRLRLTGVDGSVKSRITSIVETIATSQ